MKVLLKRVKSTVIVLVLSVGAIFSGIASAGAVDVARVSDQSWDQLGPTVSGDRLVWQDDYAGKSTIYGLKLGSSPQRLTNPSGNDRVPRVAGDIAVFERRSAPGTVVDSDIWMYRFSTGSESVVSDSPNTQYSPDVSGNRVVWHEFRTPNGWDIMLKDISTGGIYTLGAHPDKSLRPRISGDLVVWSDDRYGSFDIFYYDLSVDSDGDGIPNYREAAPPSPDPALKRLTDATTIEDKPEVDAGRIVWRQFDSDHYNLYLFDLAAPQKGQQLLRRIDAIDTRPTITISGDRVVYTDAPAGADPNTNLDLYSRNLKSALTIRLTTNGSRQMAPEISGDRLVWQSDQNGWQWDVYQFAFDQVAPVSPAPIYVIDTKRGRQLKIRWSAASAGDAWLYDVERKISRGSWQFIRRGSKRIFYDNGLPQGPRIYYRVRTIDWSGNIGAYSAPGSAVVTDKLAPQAPVVRSKSHPNQSKWYRTNDVALTWTPPSDASGIRGYSYVMDRRARTIPDKRVEGWRSARTASNRAEGIWYFHIRAKDRSGNWGPTSHFRIRIDTRPPKMIRRSPGKLVKGVDRDALVIVRFKDTSNIHRRTLNKNSFFLVHSRTGRKVPAVVSFNGPRKTAFLRPATRLAPKMWYRVRMTTGIKDRAQWRFRGTGWSFRTGTR